MDQLNEKTGTWRSSRSNYGRLINYDHFRPRVFHINDLKNNNMITFRERCTKKS